MYAPSLCRMRQRWWKNTVNGFFKSFTSYHIIASRLCPFDILFFNRLISTRQQTTCTSTGTCIHVIICIDIITMKQQCNDNIAISSEACPAALTSVLSTEQLRVAHTLAALQRAQTHPGRLHLLQQRASLQVGTDHGDAEYEAS